MARIYVDSCRVAYAGILPFEFLDNLSYRETEQRWLTDKQHPGKAFVAETLNGEPVGFAEAGPARNNNPDYDAELYLIYLLAAYQRQGLGQRLVGAVASDLRSSGYQSMLVWAIRDTAACCFYESLGGKPVGWGVSLDEENAVEEVCYGWDNIDDLAIGPG